MYKNDLYVFELYSDKRNNNYVIKCILINYNMYL